MIYFNLTPFICMDLETIFHKYIIIGSNNDEWPLIDGNEATLCDN